MVDEPRCPGCGRAVAAGDRFCSACGARLGEAPGAGEERKLVSVVFVDLVGYTGLAESHDPEDTRRVLDAYWTGVREELERHGGTVEKFIGDAVVGLFGAPVAHEDDAERAVRAALAIRDRPSEATRPEVRIAVATGVALVRLAARPEAGEALVVGDVVPTAARLQEGAPAGGVLVDEPTRAATREAVRYRRVAAVAAKGKREPIAAWRAVGPRAPGRRRAATRFVGRRDELSLLRTLLARTRAGAGVGLVTVVGEPGIGKSRLVHELGTGDAERWEARVAPYGEGSAFSPLAELFAERMGADGVASFLADLFPDDEERRRVELHVLRLVGLDRADGAVAERGLESFAAWRRVLEATAARRPLVLVLEDLQWADDALLDFAEHLVEWAAPVPLLVLCTARPDLLRRRPGWGGGAQNALTLSLAPLTDAETARLVADVLGCGPREQECAVLVNRAGGNPLYAEQLARMLAETGAPADDIPGTVHAVIAARIDRLPADEKLLLLDAAVVGPSFAPEALVALAGRDDAAVEAGLHALERLELVARRGGDDRDWAFRHRLVREVAYGALARAARVEKHRQVATWLEAQGRGDGATEQVAYHYLRAREEAIACGLAHAELDGRAREALVLAAARALRLDAFAAAARLYAQALDLWPAGGAERARHLLGYARALWSGEMSGEAVAGEARDGLLAAGDPEGAAEAETLLSEMRWYRGDRAAAQEHLARAVELVSGRPPSVAKASVLARQARAQMLAGNWREAVESGRETLALAEQLGLVDLQAEALNSIGSARFRAGEPDGIHDLERAIELAAGSRAAVVAYNNLGALLLEVGERACSQEVLERGCKLAHQLGDRLHVDWFESQELTFGFDEGRWDDVLAAADRWLASPHHPTYPTIGVLAARALMRHARGDDAGALEDLGRAERDARAAGDPQTLVPTLAQAAFVHLEEGRTAEARRRLEEALALCERSGDVPPLAAFDLAVTARGCGLGSRLRAAIERVAAPSRWLDVARDVLDGDFDAALEALDATHSRWAGAYVRLLAAAEGRDGLDEALAFYRTAGAARYVRRCEELVEATATATAR